MSTDPEGVVLGWELDRRRPVLLSGRARTTHMEIIGASGLGKTRFMEHMIREDIIERRGVCVIDPTGNLYKRIVDWLARNPDLDPPVVLFDPAENDYVTGYNPIRRTSKDMDFRVDEILNAIARVWGAGDLQQTPLLKRCLKLIFMALAERGLTLAEARYFINPKGKDLREYLATPLGATIAGELWAHYNSEKSAAQFVADFSSTVNRLLDFSAPRLQRIFGQAETSLDLRQVMDQGGVLLVNLSRQGLSEDAARLIGTLLVYDFFLTATERPEGSQPFYLYVDECYDFVTEDLGKILDRCRQHGLHAVLAHQHLAQLKGAGETVYMAMRTDTKVKVVFGGLVPEEARQIAEQIYMGELDPDEVKHEMYRTLEHHRLQWIDIHTRSRSHTSGDSEGHGQQSAAGGAQTYLPEAGLFGPGEIGGARTEQMSDGESFQQAHTESETDGESVTTAPMLIPEEDAELSSVQYRQLDEQLYRAMATMINQPAQQAVVKILTGRTCRIETPTIPDQETPADIVRDYTVERYESVPFCVPRAAAELAIKQRAEALLANAAAAQFAALPLPDVHSGVDYGSIPSLQPAPVRSRVSKSGRKSKSKTTIHGDPE